MSLSAPSPSANSCSKLNGATPTTAHLVHMQIWGTWGESGKLDCPFSIFYLPVVYPSRCLWPLGCCLAPTKPPLPASAPWLYSFYLKPKWNILRDGTDNAGPARNSELWCVRTSIGHGHGQRHGSSFSRAHIIKFAQRTPHTHTHTQRLVALHTFCLSS